MRILFWPPRGGVNTLEQPFPHAVGLPPGMTSSLSGISAELGSVSKNSGNMVHVEAPSHTFACDRHNSFYSALVNPRIVAGRGGSAAPSRSLPAVDAVCLSFANMIRSYKNTPVPLSRARRTWTNLTAQLRTIETPIYSFGIGMQESLPDEPSAIPVELFDLLKTLNDRARLFGVRGPATAAWLHKVGLRNAVPLGCPSLYVFPRNILGLKPVLPGRDSVVGTAGRLQPGAHLQERRAPLRQIAESFSARYVFQNDLLALMKKDDTDPVYNDATGEISSDAVHRRIRQKIGDFSKFDRYYFFRDTSRWRMFAHGCDFYVGDRFHGGVVFLQAGRPALILQADERVRELTGFLGIPTLAVEQLTSGDARAAVAHALSAEAIGRFIETYRARLREYIAVCEQAGLRFADAPALGAA